MIESNLYPKDYPNGTHNHRFTVTGNVVELPMSPFKQELQMKKHSNSSPTHPIESINNNGYEGNKASSTSIQSSYSRPTGKTPTGNGSNLFNKSLLSDTKSSSLNRTTPERSQKSKMDETSKNHVDRINDLLSDKEFEIRKGSENKLSSYFSQTSLNLISKAYEMKRYVEKELNSDDEETSIDIDRARGSKYDKYGPNYYDKHREPTKHKRVPILIPQPTSSEKREQTKQNIQEFERYKSEILDLRNEVSQLHNNLKNEKEKRRRDRSNFDMVKEQQDKQLQMKEETLDKFKKIVEELEFANKKKDNESLILIQDKSNLRNKLSKLEKMLSEKEEKIRSQDRTHLKPLLEEYQKQINNLIKTHEEEVQRFNRENGELRIIIQNQNKEIEENDEIKQKLENLEAEYEEFKATTEQTIAEYEDQMSKYEMSVQNMIEEKRTLNDSFNQSMDQVYDQIIEREKSKNEAIELLENVNKELRDDLSLIHEQFRQRMQEKDVENHNLILQMKQLRDEDYATQSVIQITKEVKYCLGEVRSLIHLIESRSNEASSIFDTNKTFSPREVQQENNHAAALRNVLLLRKDLEHLKATVTEQYSLHISSAVNDCTTQ